MRNNLDQLNAFLSQVVTSSYSQLKYENFNSLIANNDNLVGISGAAEPVLPMTISVGDKNNNRLQFTLLINPNNLTHGKTVAVDAQYTREGFVTQMWGPRQDILTATGTTAAFYAPMIDQPETSTVAGVVVTPRNVLGSEGLTVTNRRSSLGMQNFMALLYAYRNNGYSLIDPTALQNVLTRVIDVVHGVEIEFDGQIFMGHFNSFTLDENAEKPFVFNYNFDFVISSLSNNYNEIRGHFIPIGQKIVSTGLTERLLKSVQRRGVTKTKSTLVPPSQSTPRVAEGSVPENIPNLGQDFNTAVQQVSAKLGIKDSTWLKNLILFESSGDPNAKNPYSSARGLIQFMNSTARGLGYASSADLVQKNPSITDQMLGPVYKYLSQYGPYPTEQKLYMAVFYPAARNASPNYVFPTDVRAVNPGIYDVQSYINKVHVKAARVSARSK